MFDLTITENLRLYDLLEAIYHNQPAAVKGLCCMLAYNPDIVNRELGDKMLSSFEISYKGYKCLDMFYRLLISSKDKNAVDDSIIDIFRTLVSHGMEWENEKVRLCDKYTSYSAFINLIFESGHWDFFMTALTLSRNVDHLLDQSHTLTTNMSYRLIEYIDNCDLNRLQQKLSVLTPETKGLFFSNYIHRKNLINYYRTDPTPVRTGMTKLLILRNIGNIQWKNNLDRTYPISLSELYSAAYEYRIDHNYIEELHNINYCLTIISILISAGDDTKFKVYGRAILERFLLDRPNRWLLKRERTLELPLPIPLEAKLSLWEAGNMGGIFDRLQLSMLMR